MLTPERELTWLRHVRDVSQKLAAETELGALLPFILDAAVEITGAERGFLVLIADGAARVKEARGYDKSELGREVAHVSRTVVERVVSRGGEGLVTTSEQDQDVIDVSSVKERRVVSILCVPLRLRGEVRGVLYLDHRITRGAFSETDLTILQPFADQAALALDTLAADEPAGEGPARTRFGALVGGAPVMQALYDEIERAARSWTSVVILGERGTGKELVAREVHDRSDRKAQPFVTLTCSAGTTPLDDRLLEAFHAAGAGTLFLDAVDELSPQLQGELLRVLREGRVAAPGTTVTSHVRCRVVVASHQDLRVLAETDAFRQDLYYQLDVHRIIAPPLRQHPEDVGLLIDHFVRLRSDKGSLKLSAHALDVLRAYAWPGNVRQLENEVERLLAASGPGPIPAKVLSEEVRQGEGVGGPKTEFAGMTLEGAERELIQAALANCKGNKARAARQLGVPRSTLYHLLERHGL